MTTLTMKGYSAIARALADNEVKTLFGLIGDGNLYIANSFVRECGGTFVSSAHENGAILMALGFGSVSGDVGVATVTHGPALVNTLTALVEGVKASLPMVLLCGDTAMEDKNNLQNVPQRELVIATGAGFEQLRAPGTISLDVASAFKRAATERRPIALNMPTEFMLLDVEYRAVRFRVPEDRAFVPSSADLDDAIGIIAAAKRPIVLAGRGAVRAKDSILRLAERIEAPVATTLKGKSLFEGEPFNLGLFGTLSSPATVDAIMASDTIVAFGASLNDFTVAKGTFVKEKRVVQVARDQCAIGRYTMPDVGIVGDATLVTEAIIGWLDEAEIAPSGFRAELEGKIDGTYPSVEPLQNGQDGTVDISTALRRLNQAVPQNRVLVVDGGRFARQAWKLVDAPDPDSFLFTVHFGSIGLGLGYAIGAAHAAPGRPTLLVTGDGGFMLGGLLEFNTAVRTKADLIVIVCNDGSYGAEHIQFRNRCMDPGLSVFEWPDFGPVAAALGGAGVTVRSVADLEFAAEAIKNRQGPLLIDVKLNPDQVPSG